MALIKLGGLAQDVRGSLNGTTFSRNRGGAYVRSKVSPVQPVSTFSSAARAAFKAVSQAWAAELNDIQRAGWAAFAALHPFVNVFGDSLVLSGINMYQALNVRQVQLGFDRVDDPPVTFTAPSVLSLDASMTETDGLVVTFLTGATLSDVLSGDQTMYVFATPVLAPGAVPVESDFRLINLRNGTAVAVDDDLTEAYLARFPDIFVDEGAKIAIRVAVLDTVTGCVGVGVTAILFAEATP